jgi:polar amino acid transport system substrate-binding protein
MYVTPERQKQADAIPYALSGASIIALKARCSRKPKMSCAA